MKTASASQIDQLEILNKKIQLSKDSDAISEMLLQIEELLKDIDFMSPFYTNFANDMRIYKSQKVTTVQSSLLKILDDAIKSYKQK